MFSRIDISDIIIGHFKTFKSLNDGKMIWWDIILMVLFPIVISIFLVRHNITLDNIMGDLIKAIAVFGAFLFNLLALIYNLKEKLKQSTKDDPIKSLFAKHIHANIAYSILLSIVMIILFIVYEIVQTLNTC